MICPYMIKTALNAQKMRQMAKSVGLIPHPKSQWKWALRQMRKANPKGIKNAPIMQKGKELAKTKEKVGKLSNNIKQKLKALQRKQKLGVEVGYNSDGHMVAGEYGRIPIIDNNTLRAHTHPNFKKVIHLKGIKTDRLDSEASRLLDNVLSSSPSGISYDYSDAKALKRIIASDKLRATSRKLSKLHNLTNNRYLRNDKMIADRHYREMKLLSLMDFKERHEAIKAYNKLKDNNYSLFSKRMNKINKILTPIVEKLRKSPELKYNAKRYIGGDAEIIHKIPNLIHSILSQGVEGVHKSNLKLPNAIRSVYFKGGL